MAEHLLTPNDFIAGIAKEMEKQKLRMEQPPTPYQLEQEVRMKADLEKYELEQEFIYKGVRCYMKRPHGTFWCGYLDCGIVASVFDRLKGIAHGGMTTHNGFDCAHLHDYPCDPDGTYRDYEYVRSVLEKMVDEVTK